MIVVVFAGIIVLFFLLTALVPIGWALATAEANGDIFLTIFAAPESTLGVMTAGITRVMFQRESKTDPV